MAGSRAKPAVLLVVAGVAFVALLGTAAGDAVFRDHDQTVLSCSDDAPTLEPEGDAVVAYEDLPTDRRAAFDRTGSRRFVSVTGETARYFERQPFVRKGDELFVCQAG
jgi:hypothetical protein